MIFMHGSLDLGRVASIPKRLGAKQDGILRNHQIGPDGTYRDTVVISNINSEWNVVKISLQFKLRQ